MAELNTVPETAFSSDVTLARHFRQTYSGTAPAILRDIGSHTDGLEGRIYFPVGTAPSLVVPGQWKLLGAFNALANNLLALTVAGGRIRADIVEIIE